MPTPITEEQHLHDAWYEKAKTVTTPEELAEFVTFLTTNYEHDYGTICHAVAATALAAAWCVSPSGGITGFQAGAIQWQFIKHWAGPKGPARILDYEDALYPQYRDRFTAIPRRTLTWLQEEARKKLAEPKAAIAAEAVVAHWKFLADGGVPFGLRVEESEQ